MNISQHLSDLETKRSVTARKPYHPPKLEILGSVSDLVMAGTSSTNEGNPGSKMTGGM